MSISRTNTEDLLRDFNIRAKKPTATYLLEVRAAPLRVGTGPREGDLVVLDLTGNDLVKHAAASDVPYAMVQSVNSDNGTLSVVELNTGVTAEFEYATLTSTNGGFGNQIQAQGGTRGSILARDKVKGVDSGGVGFVYARDTGTRSGRTGTCMVRFP